jgi:carbamoyltransferase
MAHNILGIHVVHNSSVAVISDGKLVFYIEEERLSRYKRDANPFRAIAKACSKWKIDEVIIGGVCDDREFHELAWTSENLYAGFVRKFSPKVKAIGMNSLHHKLHASAAFYNSGFKEANIIVVDGAGSMHQKPDITGDQNLKVWEGETIFKANYPNNFVELYKSYGCNYGRGKKDNVEKVDDSLTITKVYEAVNGYLGFEMLDGGKTMGLSSYGKSINFPPLYINGRGNRELFFPLYPRGAGIDLKKLPKIEDQDLAYHVQKESQQEVFKLIKKSLELNKTPNIVITGGYALNCVANYFYKKSFPELNIYIEPIGFDGGNAIGAALNRWYEISNSTQINPQKSLYYGPKYSTKLIQKTLKSYNNMFNIHTTTPEKVAKLISERNIVTIFQGRSEAGPRALGNRSILYDPTDPNGKDFVNKVKNREWFRPFAGTVLLEKANEWFDMAGLEESPFMMYAMDVWPDKQEIIQAITHVDGTCRIQTVTEEQNPHYYKLIQEFEKITGVPILFNTSFNLAGDPLVETIEDALETMLKSEMKYMYVPELSYLLEKK